MIARAYMSKITLKPFFLLFAESRNIPTGHRPNKKEFSDQENMILEYLITNQKITKAAMMNLLQIKETRAKEIISKMIDKKILVKIGTARNTVYCINVD